MVKIYILILFSFLFSSCATSPEKSKYGVRGEQKIQKIFESHKVSIFSIYYKTLSLEPNLGGWVNFSIYVQVNGKVTRCQTKTEKTDLDSMAFKICKYVSKINFGEGDEFEFDYRIRFLPSVSRFNGSPFSCVSCRNYYKTQQLTSLQSWVSIC